MSSGSSGGMEQGTKHSSRCRAVLTASILSGDGEERRTRVGLRHQAGLGPHQYPKTQKLVDQQLEEAKPELLVCCPECKHWGGWYRLNRHKLPVLQQLHNQSQAKAQAEFCAQQIRRQLKRGGRVLLGHPWSGDLWKHPPIQRLLQSGQLTLHKAHMCAYNLQDPNSEQPILKPTGLAVSHEDMAQFALECPGHAHQLLAGHSSDGVNRSARAAEYTSMFVHTWLQCIRPHLCHFSSVQDSMSDCEGLKVEIQEVCAASEVMQVEQLVRKLHNNLGHPSTRTLLRILKNAGANETAVRAAEMVEKSCEICQQRQRPTPSLPANPEHVQDFNHKIGWDTKLLPGWKVNQQVKCMNIVDHATSFQVMVPWFEQETSELLKKLFLETWQRWAGSPVEVVVDGIRISTIAAKAHNQLGKVEKHGHLFEVILQKVIDQAQPKDRAEYEQCIIQTCNAKNELLNQEGVVTVPIGVW